MPEGMSVWEPQDGREPQYQIYIEGEVSHTGAFVHFAHHRFTEGRLSSEFGYFFLDDGIEGQVFGGNHSEKNTNDKTRPIWPKNNRNNFAMIMEISETVMVLDTS
jgi:hypothetical protein